MAQHLAEKLSNFLRLLESEREAFGIAGAQRISYRARQHLVRQGDETAYMYVFLEGWACCHKILEDGRRQILSFLLPGDLCDPNIFVSRKMDYSIETCTPVQVAEIPRDALAALTVAHPRIIQALRWEALSSESILREWLVNLGQRTATERIAHLLCEIFARLRAVDLVRNDTADFPLTQTDLADATGLSTVHVNRTLQDLRSASVIVLKGRSLTVPNFGRLARIGLFSTDYLHLQRQGAHLDLEK